MTNQLIKYMPHLVIVSDGKVGKKLRKFVKGLDCLIEKDEEGHLIRLPVEQAESANIILDLYRDRMSDVEAHIQNMPVFGNADRIGDRDYFPNDLKKSSRYDECRIAGLAAMQEDIKDRAAVKKSRAIQIGKYRKMILQIKHLAESADGEFFAAADDLGLRKFEMRFFSREGIEIQKTDDGLVLQTIPANRD